MNIYATQAETRDYKRLKQVLLIIIEDTQLKSVSEVYDVLEEGFKVGGGGPGGDLVPLILHRRCRNTHS